MKRKQTLCGALLALLLTLTLLPTGAKAASRSVPVTVNGRGMSGAALLENGSTYVPIRSFLTAVAAGWDIDWERNTRSAVASREGHYVAAVTGSAALYVDGARYTAPRNITVQNGATYVPLRLLADALGLSVRWDSALGGAAVTGRVGSARYSGDDLYWLSRIISAESRGEPMTGQIAVGNVVLNRVRSADFASTVQSVVFEVQSGYTQFEPVRSGTVYDAPAASSVTAARMALAGYATVGNSLYFFDPALSSGSWIRANRTYYTTIGGHRFYL